LTNQPTSPDLSEAVLDEIKKGYDMLFLGLDDVLQGNRKPDNEADSAVEKILQEFAGAVAIVVAKEAPKLAQTDALRILMPTSGTDYSRRAAEVAVAIAKAGS